MSISTQLLKVISEQIAFYSVTPQRAEELANELNQLHKTVEETAQILKFDDEPIGFIACLEKTSK